MITIHNAETGEIIQREMNAKELAQHQADIEANALRAQAQATADAAHIAAVAKLEKLGLTVEDLQALGL